MFEGHPEEYNADRAEVIAMIELGYDPMDAIEAMQAFDLMGSSRKMGFAPSHPFFNPTATQPVPYCSAGPRL